MRRSGRARSVPCRTLSVAMRLRRATMRTPASRSTAARAGRRSSLTTTRWSTRATSRSRWVPTTSRARRRAKVVFDNHQVEYTGNIAIAMGTYYFTCATTGDETRVEYTFGYKRCDDGKARIFLHHSSVPYAMPAAATKEKKVEEKEERRRG